MQLLCSPSLDNDRFTPAGLSKIAHRRSDTQWYAIADGGHQTKEAKLQTCPIGLPRTELPRLLLVFSAKALFTTSMAAFGVSTC